MTGSLDAAAYSLGQQALANARKITLRPVGCNTNFPWATSSNQGITAGYQIQTKSLHYFPKGGANLRLMVVGGAFAGAVEGANTSPFPLKLSCAVEPGIWNPLLNYTAGQTVFWYPSSSGLNSGTSSNNPYYTCVTGNTNSMPGPANANWTPALRPTAYPVNFGGVQEANFTTKPLSSSIVYMTAGISAGAMTTTASVTLTAGMSLAMLPGLPIATVTAGGTGTSFTVSPSLTIPSGTALMAYSTVTEGRKFSDVLPVTVPVGGWLSVWGWAPMGGAQVMPVGSQSQATFLGGGFNTGASLADQTTASLYLGANNNIQLHGVNNSNWTPAAIVGLPLSSVKSVVGIGDSIVQGVSGGANLNSITLVSGGTGYQVGDIVALGRTGATAGAVAAGGDALIYVDAVTSGAISAFHVISTGCYTSTSTQTGQTLPTGTIALTGGSGSGATCTASFSTSPHDSGDTLTGAQGWMERGFLSLGIPFSKFAAAGDRLDLWTNGAQRRLSAIGDLNADIAVVALGRNDFTNGDTLATYQANTAILVAALRGMGIGKVYGCTTTPEVTSTTVNGCSTVADQVVTSNNSVRAAANAWLRSGASPYDAIIDVAALCETGGASNPSGTWNPIGGLPFAADGKHPGVSGHIALSAAITANAALFQ